MKKYLHVVQIFLNMIFIIPTQVEIQADELLYVIYDYCYNENMNLFLISNKLTDKNKTALQNFLGKKRVSKALFMTAAAVPYGLDEKPDWLLRSLEEISAFTDSFDEVNLENKEVIPGSLANYDFIFVSGGNSFYLAYRLAVTGMDMLIRNYIQEGGYYIGSSAGSLILMDDISGFKFADDPLSAPRIYPGLNIIKEAIIPHVDNEYYGEIMHETNLDYKNKKYEVILLNDDQVYIVDGDKKYIS